MGSLEAGGKIAGRGAGEEIAIGIVVRRQVYDVRCHRGAFQTLTELLRGLLTGLVCILVKDEVDHTARRAAKLIHPGGRQMCADGGSGIAKAGLPQHGQVEESLHQDHGGELADRVPGKQAALGARQQTVRERGADTAAIEIDDLAVLAAGSRGGRRHRGPEG